MALWKAGLAKAYVRDAPAEDHKEAARLVDAAIGLLPHSLNEDERNPDLDHIWVQLCLSAITVHRRLQDGQAAFDHVDGLLAPTPAAKALRFKVMGTFLTTFAWEARGTGLAGTVTRDGWAKYGERLTGARQAFLQAWDAAPGDGYTAMRMLIVDMGLGGDRDEMEQWFRRARQGRTSEIEGGWCLRVRRRRGAGAMLS